MNTPAITPQPGRASPPGGVPKLIGSDTELGNCILGLDLEHGTGALASRALLREIPGLPRQASDGTLAELFRSLASPVADPQDWGRKYLPANGGCCYDDLDHLELCTPEVRSASDYAASFHAMLRIARRALHGANARLPDGLKIVAVVNNSDGQGHSYGAHLSFLLTRAAWDRLFHRQLQELLTLASFQVSSVILTGQGKVGPERVRGGDGPARYELSQRASFFECLVGPQTTHTRPIVNSRDEALCGRFRGVDGPADQLARLHSIFFDATLCPVSLILKAGLMQLVLALLEAGETDTELILHDPVETVARWSRDVELTARARLISGREVNALELQQLFLEKAARFVDAGRCEGVVPQARELIALWAETLDQLRRRDFAALAPRLDWVLKLAILSRAQQQQAGLGWGSPEIKHLDFKYADLEDGLFWNLYAGGAVEPHGITEAAIRRFMDEPPEDSRAWTRAQLLRRAGPGQVVEDVDWDRMTFTLRDPSGRENRRTFMLAHPLGWTRAAAEPALQRAGDLEQTLDGLEDLTQNPTSL